MYTKEEVMQRVSDEAGGFRFVQELQNAYRNNYFTLVNKVEVVSRAQAIERGIKTVQTILTDLRIAGVTYEKADPGHGLGHVVRDYVNGLRLLTTLDADPKELFTGFVAGVLHDTACGVVRRYDERQSVVKHAGVAAYVLDGLFQAREDRFGLNTAERQLIELGIAAHTHHLTQVEATGQDGIRRILDPYPAQAQDGIPFLALWLPRWIDRLDNNGPTYLGRHYLTLANAHEDFANGGYYPVEYGPHMRPLLREDPEIKADGNRRTMLEHFAMFAQSQSKWSPYGKFDFGSMLTFRDGQTRRSANIMRAVAQSYDLSTDMRQRTLRAWSDFLAMNVEPYPTVGRPTADKLEELFDGLPDDVREAWTSGFHATMREYCGWAKEVLADLDALPTKWMSFQFIPDVRDIIRPKRAWTVSLGFAD